MTLERTLLLSLALGTAACGDNGNATSSSSSSSTGTTESTTTSPTATTAPTTGDTGTTVDPLNLKSYMWRVFCNPPA